MYEELLPLWKARCRAFRDNNLGGGVLENNLIKTLQSRGIYHPLNSDFMRVPKVGTFEWIEEPSGHSSLLVLGVMLFTWEQGVKDET